MCRARLTSLVLASGLMLVSGCCWNYPVLSRLRNRDLCECQVVDAGSMGMMSETPVLVPPEGGVPSSEALPPGVPPLGAPPRIMPIPQAAPVPYTPTRLRRLFSGFGAD